jgi:hypothetical protein
MDTEKTNQRLAKVGSTDIYRVAVERIVSELENIRQWKKDMLIREGQLNESLKALRPLAGGYQYDLSQFSLSDAVRFIFNGLEEGRGLSAVDVRTKLLDLSYDLSKYENPLASIHTCMRRMGETEELIFRATDDDNKKTFSAGPELKSVPEPPMSPPGIGGETAEYECPDVVQGERKEGNDS